MHRITKRHKTCIKALIDHWHRFLPPSESTADTQIPHQTWLERHSKYQEYSSGSYLFHEGWTDRLVFYVYSGKIARIEEDGSRKILSVGLPGMALMSNEHLYTESQPQGSIIALCRSRILIMPSLHIIRFKETEKSLDTLIDVLTNKKKSQLSRLRSVSLIKEATPRYLEFVQRLPELHAALTQHEQKDLLQISRSTLQRASLSLVLGSKKQK